jgi:hypothetical protein
MPEYSNFSSLPPNLEVGFIPYEERMASAQQKSLVAAIFAGAVTLVLAIGIYMGVAPDDTDLGKDMNMSNLSRTSDDTGAMTTSAPAAAPAPAAEGSGSAAAPAAGSAAPAAGSAAPAAEAGSASGSN